MGARVILYLTVDHAGSVRTSKRPPRRRPWEYVWKLNILLPDAPPSGELTLEVPQLDPASLVEVDE